MDSIEKFIRQVSYKFPKGYPDMNNEQDIQLLNTLLEELGVNPNTNPKKDLKSTIKDLTGKQKGPSKLETFTNLAILTYEQYKSNLGEIIKIFPNPISKIEDWKSYIDEDSSNKGVSVENSIKNYVIKKKVKAEKIGGKGEDLLIGDKIVEIKSMKDNKINTQLQTSFYMNDPNKFYMFISNTSAPDIDVRIVSSQLLYKAALGDEIVDEIEKSKGEGSDILSKQLDDGLKKLDVKKFIMSSLLTGKTSEETKSFFIGKDNNIRVRFIINIEPK